MGSVFSPYYAWSGRGRPENHCAINVALYGPRARWAMTERGAGQVVREADRFQVGQSALVWEDDGLTIDVREHCAPLPFPLRGRVRVEPSFVTDAVFELDPEGDHAWRPIASHARVTAHFEEPPIAWSGVGYLDSNWGECALEETFRYWTWSRAALDGTGAAICYDIDRRDGGETELCVRFDASGVPERFAPPPRHALGRGLWGVSRSARSESDRPAVLERTLEDSPFYTRSELRMGLFGGHRPAVHESLDLDRFRSPVVKLMLPFRMPRIAG